MAKLKLTGKDLRAIGYPEGPVISIAMNIMEKNYKFEKEEEVMNLLKLILASPVEYTDDAVLGLIAQQLMPKPKEAGDEIALRDTGVPFNVFGSEHIEAPEPPPAAARRLVPPLAFIQHIEDGFFYPVLFRESDQMSPSRYHPDIQGGDIY